MVDLCFCLNLFFDQRYGGEVAKRPERGYAEPGVARAPKGRAPNLKGKNRFECFGQVEKTNSFETLV